MCARARRIHGPGNNKLSTARRKKKEKMKGKHFFLLLLLPFGTGRRLRFRLAVTHTPIQFSFHLDYNKEPRGSLSSSSLLIEKILCSAPAMGSQYLQT